MESTLYLIIFVLGLLAFFEPCTIATHTLFIARTHKQTNNQIFSRLLVVWLARSLLFCSILALAVIFIPTPVWPTSTFSVILVMMALLYLVSRFTYIPVPHLNFYRLLPFTDALPDPVKLGLSLPACTIPLFVVITGLNLQYDNLIIALISGLTFATGFSAPLVIVTLKGINENVQDFLQHAAKGSPYLTAILLIGGALYILLPGIDLSSKALKISLEHASWTGIGLSFLAGFVFSFNPVSFASIPVMLAYVTKAHEERRAILMGSAFVLGMITTHVVLGVAAAISGDGIKSVLGREWSLLLGPVLIILGLIWTGWLKIRLPWFGMRARKVSGIGGAFLLAIPFSVAVCPFCTPALLVTLTASAAIGSISFGFALLLAFALGRSIPIILGAWSMGWLESLKILSRYQKIFEIIAGIVLILVGLYLLNEYFFIIEI
ncbi:MAG: sulfite exporter TauE/SafE family protein [Gammaproteobacteria bacterium]|nr:sulfite exporter TauE/SafE family protein [Gammaproteobacteria bacterium]